MTGQLAEYEAQKYKVFVSITKGTDDFQDEYRNVLNGKISAVNIAIFAPVLNRIK